MACCFKVNEHADANVLDTCRIRFPPSSIKNASDVVLAVRYAVGKTEATIGRAPGGQKKRCVVSVIDVLMRDVATDQARKIYEDIGGSLFVEDVIDIICSASKRASTRGV
jgi:hypothetical protein